MERVDIDIGSANGLPSSAVAEIESWVNSRSALDQWEIDGRWKPNGVPKQSDDVRVIAASQQVAIAPNSPVEISSFILNGGSTIFSRSDIDILRCGRLGDGVIDLLNSAQFNVGSGVINQDEGELTLINNSKISLVDRSFGVGPLDRMTLHVPLYVDTSSELSGGGVINTYSEIDLNGRLKTGELTYSV